MKARAIILISGAASQAPNQLVDETLKPFTLSILDRQEILMAGRMILALEIELDRAHLDAVESDLIKALEASGFRAAFAGSENSNELDRVEDEIFAFERAIAASGELELMLADPNITRESRIKIINDLVGKTFTQTSIELVNYALGNRHGRSITTTLKDLSKLAADRRGRLLAEITTAIALSADQETRLVSALKAIYKQDIQLKKVVDKKVIGGVAVRIGDEVIDGTVSSRIAQIKKELAV